MTKLDEHIGQRIQLRRLELRLSVDQVAQHLDISSSALNGYEDGAQRVPAFQLALLAGLLETSVAFFFDKYYQPETSASDEQIDKLLTAFRAIESNEVRDYIVDLASMVGNNDQKTHIVTTTS